MALSCKIDMTSQLCWLSSDLHKIWQPNAESHADDGEKVSMETESRILVWQPFALGTRSSNISAVDWAIY